MGIILTCISTITIAPFWILGMGNLFVFILFHLFHKVWRSGRILLNQSHDETGRVQTDRGGDLSAWRNCRILGLHRLLPWVSELLCVWPSQRIIFQWKTPALQCSMFSWLDSAYEGCCTWAVSWNDWVTEKTLLQGYREKSLRDCENSCLKAVSFSVFDLINKIAVVAAHLLAFEKRNLIH